MNRELPVINLKISVSLDGNIGDFEEESKTVNKIKKKKET